VITGFARLHWGASPSQVRVLYPSTRTTPVYEGRHPITKETVRVGGETLIPELDMIAGVTMNATLGFDAKGGLDTIELWPDDTGDMRAAVNEILHRLGLAAIEALDEPHAWSANGARVELEVDDGFRIAIRAERG
jgi:hypothetical protein